MRSAICSLWRDEAGTVPVEYALLLGVLGVGMVGGLVGLAEFAARMLTRFLDEGPGVGQKCGVVGIMPK